MYARAWTSCWILVVVGYSALTTVRDDGTVKAAQGYQPHFGAFPESTMGVLAYVPREAEMSEPEGKAFTQSVALAGAAKAPAKTSPAATPATAFPIMMTPCLDGGHSMPCEGNLVSDPRPTPGAFPPGVNGVSRISRSHGHAPPGTHT